MHTFDLKLDELTKVEGSAQLEVKVKDGKVERVEFKITEFKRFFTKALEGKPIIALPQLLARICDVFKRAHTCEHRSGRTCASDRAYGADEDFTRSYDGRTYHSRSCSSSLYVCDA